MGEMRCCRVYIELITPIFDRLRSANDIMSNTDDIAAAKAMFNIIIEIIVITTFQFTGCLYLPKV